MAALPVESSWRMVEGEHDSFDTSIVPNAFGLSGEYGDDGDDPFVSSSGAPSQQSAESSSGLAAATGSSRRGLGKRTVSGVSGMSGMSRGGGGGASSSQEDRISLGGESFGGSVVGSQDDDIHSFLRKAENDERVLLRSPFQPSLPSSARQSPMSASSAGKASKTTVTAGSSRLDRTTFQTPEPEFRMPTIDMDGSLHAGDAQPQNQRVAGISSSFRVSDTGSPAQRRRTTGGGLLSRLNGRQARTENDTGSSSSENGPSTATAAWRRTVPSGPALFFVLLPLLGLIAAYGTPLFDLTTTTTTTNTVCSLPGVRYIGLPFCSPMPNTNNKATVPTQDGSTNAETVQDTNYWAVRNRFNSEARQALTEKQVPPPVKPVVSLVRSAGQLMRVQTQLADVVKDRVLVRRSRNKDNSVPRPAQDAWLVPRAQTKDLRLAAQIQSGQAKQESKSQNSATLLLVELDTYLDAAKRVSIALTRLQTGAAATAADTLAYRSRQTLAQLRRIATREGGNNEGSNGDDDGWLSRIFSSASSTLRAQLRDTYRHHVDAVLAKTQLRVTEAEAVFRALEVAGQHLAGVQQYVVARKLELIGKNIEQEKDKTSTSTSTSASSTGGGPGGDPLLETSGGLFSWLWSDVFGRQPEDLHNLSTTKMSKAARAWSGYADQLQRLYDDHEAAVGRAAETLDDISAVRDALSVLQTQLDEDSVDDASSNDEGDLDMRLHMDIVDAGIQDLEKVGR